MRKLEQNSQQAPFYNTTDWTLRKVYEEDPTLLEKNFRAYVNGFSPNVDDIIEQPIYSVYSGPAMAPVAAIVYSEHEELPNDVIVFDTAPTGRGSRASRTPPGGRPPPSPPARSAARRGGGAGTRGAPGSRRRAGARAAP